MDIQERANAYAKGRLASIVEKLIAGIYSDGYEAGYKARSEEVDEVVLQKIAEAKAEVARAEAIKAAERAETERLAREKAMAEKAEAERLAREKAEAEKAETERIARLEAEKKRIALEEAKAKKIAKKKAENDKKDTSISDVEFVDLNLPSGTLWAKNYIGEMTFREALKQYHLPTIEQINELQRECKLTMSSSGNLKVINGDGKSFIIYNTYSCYRDRSTYYESNFWIDEEEDSNKNVRYANFNYSIVGSSVSLVFRNMFVGEPLSVLVVKSKQ